MNRRRNWIVALMGAVLCIVAYFIIINQRAKAQSANQLYVEESECRVIALRWKQKPPEYNAHIAVGNFGALYCPWGVEYWTHPTWIWDNGSDYVYTMKPASGQTIPMAGLPWQQCLITGYIQYDYGGATHNKYIEYPGSYDGFLDCWLNMIPFTVRDDLMPKTYDPYPAPESATIEITSDTVKDKSKPPKDNPYP